MAQRVVFDRVGLAQPLECIWQAATCHANSSAVQAGLQHNFICTEDVITTAAWRTCKKATDMFSGHDCIFLVEQAQNEWQLIDVLDFSVRGVDLPPTRPPPQQRSHPCLSPSHTMVCVWRQIWTHAYVRPRDAFVSLSTLFLKDAGFVWYAGTSFLRFFSNFFDQLLLRKWFLRKKSAPKTKIFLWWKYQKKTCFRSFFFCPFRVDLTQEFAATLMDAFEHFFFFFEHVSPTPPIHPYLALRRLGIWSRKGGIRPYLTKLVFILKIQNLTQGSI